jgi:hypothetical protein
MTSKFLSLRTAAIGIVVAVSLAAVPPAFATEATGNQNPDLTVFVSLMPDAAMVGETVYVVVSVKNNKPWAFNFRLEEVRLDVTLLLPNGDPLTISGNIYLLPEQKVRVALDYKVPNFIPKGQYTLKLAATEVREPGAGESSAAATLEIL